MDRRTNVALDALRSALTEVSENEWRERITAALKKAYEKDGLDGLKRAAYGLEADGASKQMLGSILGIVASKGELDGVKVKSPSKHGLHTLGQYADDLKHGKSW